MSLLAKKLANFIFDNYTDTNLKDKIAKEFGIEKIDSIANAFRFWHKGFLYNIIYHSDIVHITKHCNSATFGWIKDYSEIFTKEN